MYDMVVMKLAVLLCLSTLAVAQQIPPGTVVPIVLDTALDASKTKSDKKIEGRVMQDVPFSAKETIKERSRIRGHIVNVVKPGPAGSSITVRFDVISDRGRTIPITAALLAIASDAAVYEAQSPINVTSDRDPMTQWTTRQIGGDVVARAQGKAGSKNGVTGTWIGGTSVEIKLTPNPEAGCPDGPGYGEEQAVWVFSSGACGVYGWKDMKIEKSGSTAPIGDIVLKSERKLNVRRGSGWLLISGKKD
jgi:hypothetical protein